MEAVFEPKNQIQVSLKTILPYNSRWFLNNSQKLEGEDGCNYRQQQRANQREFLWKDQLMVGWRDGRLTSSILRRCSFQKSTFLCRESSFDVNQESFAWVSHVTGTAAWLIILVILVCWLIKNPKGKKAEKVVERAWLARCCISHTHEFTCTCVQTIMWPGEHGRGGSSTPSFSPPARMAPP